MDKNINMRPWARRARKHAADLVALGNQLDREPFRIGPTFQMRLLDLRDCARADAVQRGLPPAKRPTCALTVNAVLRNYVDGLLAELGLSPLSDAEILAADAEMPELLRPTRTTSTETVRVRDAQ